MIVDRGKEDGDTFTESVGNRNTDGTHEYLNAERRTQRHDDDVDVRI